ncbi:hypothetical protein [Actinoplanes sp. G11-F43]|uniref:hypothetical protein n=1 Tax=Actinoplanes sp. G11-F43 TaxID=3424130 RepID=UPI003D32C2E2
MPKDPDTYAIWGDWELDRFKVEISRWRDRTRPPTAAYETVNKWWPRLAQHLEWSGAVRVSRDKDPEGNQRWMWVPGADWNIPGEGSFRVACYFRTYEVDVSMPPKLVCERFHTEPVLPRYERLAP